MLCQGFHLLSKKHWFWLIDLAHLHNNHQMRKIKYFRLFTITPPEIFIFLTNILPYCYTSPLFSFFSYKIYTIINGKYPYCFQKKLGIFFKKGPELFFISCRAFFIIYLSL